MPSIMTVTAELALADSVRSPRKDALGLGTATRPSSFISNTPTYTGRQPMSTVIFMACPHKLCAEPCIAPDCRHEELASMGAEPCAGPQLQGNEQTLEVMLVSRVWMAATARK